MKRWLEPRFLGILFAATATLWVFLEIADEVAEGETHGLDTAILLALHPNGAPGPRWMFEVARDITSLGSTVVLTLLVLTSAIFLLLTRRYTTALFVVASTSLGSIVNILIKHYFDRTRPDLIGYDVYVTNASFPSGHAMLSTTVYLTLGAILARLTPDLRVRLYVLGVAAALSGLVGLSRVYLGVHWPTDVVAGWALGTAWALSAWAVAQAIHIGNARARDV